MIYEDYESGVFLIQQNSEKRCLSSLRFVFLLLLLLPWLLSDSHRLRFLLLITVSVLLLSVFSNFFGQHLVCSPVMFLISSIFVPHFGSLAISLALHFDLILQMGLQLPLRYLSHDFASTNYDVLGIQHIIQFNILIAFSSRQVFAFP